MTFYSRWFFLCVSATLVAVLPSMRATPEESGIAILMDSFPSEPGHANPDLLSSALQNAGEYVSFVSGDELADAAAFNSDRYRLIVLPYGHFFPAKACDNFLAFLRAGGDFISTGGYAFDELVIKYEGRWIGRQEALRHARPVVDIGEADQDYLIGEWYAPEAEGEAHRRWSGKGAGVKLAARAGKAYTLEASLYAHPGTSGFGKRLLVNGRQVAEIPSTGEQVLRIPLPDDVTKGRDFAEVVFDVDLWRPADLEGSPDPRALGVKVDRVALVCDDGGAEYVDLSVFQRNMNMRRGKANDFLEWEPEQLGVFDAGYRLERGDSIRLAAEQCILPKWRSRRGPVEGWAASGTTGSHWYWTTPTDRSRLIPLLETHDACGRFVGNAGALMVNYLEPYRGSVWAYFGVENNDVFAGRAGERLLASLAAVTSRGLFLQEARPSKACYRQGDDVEILAAVSNFRKEKRRVEIVVGVKEESEKHVIGAKREMDLEALETRQISVPWRPESFGDDYYTVEVKLLFDGESIDCQKTAFYAWNDAVVVGGMPISYSENVLRDDGQPRFLVGAQSFYAQKTVSSNDPLSVERDFREMADMGIHLSRSFTRVKDLPFIDALVMASQRHRVAFFLEGVASLTVDSQEHAADIEYARSIAERYADVPGLMIDIRNEPTFYPGPNEKMDVAFRQYLKGLYPNDEALRSSWAGELTANETLSTTKCTWPTSEWTSIRSRDTYRFFIEREKGWVDSVTGCIKAKDPDRLVSVGYLPWWPEMVMDAATTSEALDFTNRHWYDRFENIREHDAQFVQTDRRYCGKAPSVGEFGSKTFPTFEETHANYDTREEQELRYLHIGHYALGLGGIFVSNWHWRDPVSNVFPFGLVHADWTPKPVAKVYRAMSLLFSTLKPRYVSPEVFLVLPDESRLGGGSGRIFQAVERSALGLMGAHIRFGTINEWDLARLPDAARFLILPSPFALSDEGYSLLRTFVEKGGTLYVSGDFSFDENRHRTKVNRLEEFASVKFLKERYPDVQVEKGTKGTVRYAAGFEYEGCPAIDIEPNDGAEVLATFGDRPVAVCSPIGGGKVVFSTDPAEFFENAPLHAIYDLAAKRADVAREFLEPASPDLNVFRLPLEEAGEALIVANNSKETVTARVRTSAHEYRLPVAAQRQAAVVEYGGKLVALEAQGAVWRDGKPVFEASGHFFLVSLDEADLSVSLARALVMLETGRCTIPSIDTEIEAGEVSSREWHAWTCLSPREGRLEVPEGVVGDLILLADSGKVAAARDRLARLLSQRNSKIDQFSIR